jgi:predicted dehydrogenase
MTSAVKNDVHVAVLGVGRWGRKLFSNLHELGAIHAVVDPRPEVRDEVGATHTDVAAWTEPKDVFDSDAVV